MRIMGAVCADEPSQLRAGERQLDELILRWVVEPLAPDKEALSGQISVEERVIEGAPIVLTPVTRVEVRNGLSVGRSCEPILDHPPTLLSNGSAVPLRPTALTANAGAPRPRQNGTTSRLK